MTISITTIDAECRYAECHYAKCRRAPMISLLIRNLQNDQNFQNRSNVEITEPKINIFNTWGAPEA